MTISPKDLNQNNTGYGLKHMRHSWEANLSLLSKLQDNFNLGGYDRVIAKMCEPHATVNGNSNKRIGLILSKV